MINTIDDMIHHLEAMKKLNGGSMFIRTQIQIMKIIEVDTKVEQFYNHDKTAKLDVLIICGYVPDGRNK
jgi:hypothetical protein